MESAVILTLMIARHDKHRPSGASPVAAGASWGVRDNFRDVLHGAGDAVWAWARELSSSSAPVVFGGCSVDSIVEFAWNSPILSAVAALTASADRLTECC